MLSLLLIVPGQNNQTRYHNAVKRRDPHSSHVRVVVVNSVLTYSMVHLLLTQIDPTT